MAKSSSSVLRVFTGSLTRLAVGGCKTHTPLSTLIQLSSQETLMASVSLSTMPQLKQKIEARTASLGIFGMGYVGLPLALMFNEQGFPVIGFDIDEQKVSMINSDQSYIVRIPRSEIALARSRGFSASSDYRKVHDLDAIIICVPTPLDDFH